MNRLNGEQARRATHYYFYITYMVSPPSQVDVYQSGIDVNHTNQTYEPRFTYHAFRYVELQASPPLPPSVAALITASSVRGVNIRTDAREQATVEITNPLLTRRPSTSWWTEASG